LTEHLTYDSVTDSTMKVTETFQVISNAGGIQTDIAGLIKALGKLDENTLESLRKSKLKSSVRRYPADYEAVSTLEKCLCIPARTEQV
jgi:hypothetical protein